MQPAVFQREGAARASDARSKGSACKQDHKQGVQDLFLGAWLCNHPQGEMRGQKAPWEQPCLLLRALSRVRNGAQGAGGVHIMG